MKYLTRWFIRNPVAANLIMAFIIISGLLTLSHMRIEGFPKLPPSTISVMTYHANAHAEQIDEHITQKIEKSLEGLDGVKNIASTTINGMSEIIIKKNAGYELQRLLDDVRLRVGTVSNLPDDANKPVISRVEFDFPALYIMVGGSTSQTTETKTIDTKTLQHTAALLKKALLAQPEISKIRGLGERKPELRIEVNPLQLEKFGLTPEDVADKIQQASLFFQTGTLRTKGADFLLSTEGKAYQKTAFASIPIISLNNGARLVLGDIATISETFQNDEVMVRLNGEPAVGLELLIGRKENLLQIAKVVRQVIADTEKQVPNNIALTTFGDSSTYISERLDLLKSNAFQGLLIVIFLLALFLDTKLAFWVGMGIPISIAGTIAVMGTGWIDYSLNDITTFGMIIALGILVDDAVVIGESVFSAKTAVSDPLLATEQGVERVATATIFGVLTTVAAFSPMLMIESDLGKMLGAFSGVVVLALLFSLFESKFILPAHLAHIQANQTKTQTNSIASVVVGFWRHCQGFAQNSLHHFRDKIYAPVVLIALKHRYAVFIGFLSMAVLSVGLVYHGKVKSVFFPEVPGQIITINMEMDTQAPYHLTVANMETIERIAQDINREINEAINNDINAETVNTNDEDNPHQQSNQNNANNKVIVDVFKVVSGAYKGEIYAELSPSEQRPTVSTMDILKMWQARTGDLEGVVSLEFSGTEEISGGFIVEVFGDNPTELRLASAEIKDYLAHIDGVLNVRDSLKGGQPKLAIQLKNEAYHYGFTAQDVAIQLNGRFGSNTIQKLQRNGDEVRVILQNTKDTRANLDDFMATRLRNADGKWVPLTQIATIESGYGTDFVQRRNGKRVNSIQAYIDKSVVSSSEISQGLLTTLAPELKQRFPSVTVKPAGELEEMTDMQSGLKKALVIACLLIYILMAIPLQSYWQPFIIMSVVPFGFIGAVLGHLIMDMPLSLLSFFGMLALTGIVVNDSLVMMTQYNDKKKETHDIQQALKSASVGRFQAIFLTTATTVAGLLPLLFETSEQAQYLIPAAISLAYGEIFATTITLILIPVLIAISEDVKSIFASKQHGKQFRSQNKNQQNRLGTPSQNQPS